MKISNIVNKVCCIGLLTAAMPSGFEQVQSIDFGVAKYETSVSGEILRLSQSDARAHCSQLGKRLPTISEFIKFALQNGAKATNEASYKRDLSAVLGDPNTYFNEDWQKDTPNRIFEIRSFDMRSPTSESAANLLYKSESNHYFT